MLAVALAVFGLAQSIALGQTTFGTLLGTVSDPSGGIVPGVEITLTNLDTNVKTKTATNTDGMYTFVNVQPGRYRIDAQGSGFQHLVREPIVVETQQSYRADITLQVGSVSQTIEVKAAATLLQTQDASLGQVIGGRMVSEMPLNGRNVFNLMALSPSVVPQGGSLGTPTGPNIQTWNNYQVNGAFASEGGVFLDGMPLNNGYLNNASFVPTQDSIEEFKVQTNDLGAEWGHFNGGVINLTTKTGTNLFHGEAYEYIRNKSLNASDFFSNASGLPKPQFVQNQFGANAGGPVYLPGIYDGRNKTFWFASWEGFRLRDATTFTDSVPTAAERSGDFSSLLDSNGNLVPIYDPLTVCGKLGNPSCAVDATGQPIYTRQPFQGNVIPNGRINGTSAALFGLWPLPNTQGQRYTNVNNFTSNTVVGGNNNEAVARLDHSISEKLRIHGRFSYWNDLNLPYDVFGSSSGLCLDRCTENIQTGNIVVGATYSFTPTTVFSVDVGFGRQAYTLRPIITGFDLTSVGWPASLNSQIPAWMRSFPQPVVQGFSDDLVSTQGSGAVITSNTNNWNVSSSLTKIAGRHTLKFGVQIFPQQFNFEQTNTASGNFSFTPGFTQQGPFNPAGGSSFASYLLGNPSSGSNTLVDLEALQTIYRAFYASDTWQLTSKLTLSLGLRYELNGTWSERFNRLADWEPNATNPVVTAAGLNAKGNACWVVSSCSPSRNSEELDKRAFAPRVGFAYRLTQNTVVRSGFGLFWIPGYVAWLDSPNNSAMSGVSTPYVASSDGGVTPYGNWGNPFPSGVLQVPGNGGDLTSLMLNTGGGRLPVFNQRPGYMMQWNFDIQRELPQGFLLDVAYAGSRGIHLDMWGQQLDALPDQDLALGTGLSTSVPNPFFGLISSGPLSLATTTQSQLLLPYPQYNSVWVSNAGVGDSFYHSFQLKVERRFGASGTFLAAYTNAKLISDTDTVQSWLEGESGGVAGFPVDWNKIKGSYSLSSQDIPQRLVISYAQSLPFGHGKKFGGGVSGVADKLISGWALDGITTFESGWPMKFSSSGGGTMPNRTCANAKLSGSAENRLNEWFNTSCFSLSAPFSYGDEGRVDPNLRQQGEDNWDTALIKTTSFGPGERLGVQFRAEFFNFFNRPQFGPPATTVGLPSFGVVNSQVNNPRLVQFALKFLF